MSLFDCTNCTANLLRLVLTHFRKPIRMIFVKKVGGINKIVVAVAKTATTTNKFKKIKHYGKE